MKPNWTPLVRSNGAATRATGAALDATKELLEKLGPLEVWGNSRYTVTVRRYEAEENSTLKLIHMSIHNHERNARHDWRDFQRIKNEICGAEAEAVELYPAESRLVDTSNEYHLFCIIGFRWPFGFAERLVSESGDNIGSKQRPWEPDSKPSDLKHITLEHYRTGGVT